MSVFVVVDNDPEKPDPRLIETVDERHFGTCVLFTQFRETVSPDTYDRLTAALQSMGISDLRYPGGTVTELYFDFRNENATSVFTGKKIEPAIPQNQFFKIAGDVGAKVTLVLQTRSAFGADHMAPAALKDGTYGQRQVDPQYVADMQAYVARSLAAARAAGTEISCIEIGNEYYCGGEMTATEYGRVARALLPAISAVLNADNGGTARPMLHLQALYAAAYSSPAIDDFVYTDGFVLSSVATPGWEKYTVPGQGTAAQQMLKIADVITGRAEGGADLSKYVTALSGHSFPRKGLQYIDGADEAFIYKQLSTLETRLGFAEGTLPRHVSAWNTMAFLDSNRDGLNDAGEADNRGMPQAAMMLDIFYEMVTHGAQAANVWPLTFAGQDTTNLIDIETFALRLPGQILALMRESLVGTKPIADYMQTDATGTVDLHLYSDARHLMVFAASHDQVGDRKDTVFDLGSIGTTALQTQLRDGAYFIATTRLNGVDADGKPDSGLTNPDVRPALRYDDGFMSTGRFIDAGTISPWDITRFEITFVGAGDDTVLGRDGDDAISGLGGNDSLVGSDGNDTLDGGDGSDILKGEAGNDKLTGGAGRDTLDGGDGDDTLSDSGGGSVMVGGAGADSLDGSADNDTMFGGSGDDLISGHGGRDWVDGGDGRDTIQGGDAMDTILGGLGDDVLFGGTTGSDLGDVIRGDAGNDSIEGGSGDDEHWGDDGNDTLVGGTGKDSLDGGDGNDLLNGEAGNDALSGGAGRDTLDGGDGDDTLSDSGGGGVMSGGAGADWLSGSADVDTILGGSDDDWIFGVGGRDWLEGADGNDTIRGGDAIDTIFGGLGNDVLFGGTTGSDLGDLIHGDAGNDAIVGGAGDDELWGDDGNDSLVGGTGHDTLNGGEGDDRLIGSDHAAVLLGEAGNDLLLGGSRDGGFDVAAGSISRLYRATLGRPPDDAGHLDWTGRLAGGQQSLQEIAGGFLGSKEFRKVYGGTDDTGFITLLYANVLGRAPDPAGMADWLSRMAAGMDRTEVVLGFSESREFVRDTAAAVLDHTRTGHQTRWTDEVYRLYEATLDRAPDKDGLLDWSGRLAGGQYSLRDIAGGFIGSKEFLKMYGGTDDAGFITLLYANVLDRAPDPTGMATWLSRMAAGMSRTEVVLGFSESVEFIRHTADEMTDWMRTTGLGARLEGGAGNDTLASGVGADMFVFDPVDGVGADRVASLERWDWIDLTAFGYASVDEAIARFSQQGDSTVFQDQGITVVFEDTAMTDIQPDMLRL